MSTNPVSEETARHLLGALQRVLEAIPAVTSSGGSAASTSGPNVSPNDSGAGGSGSRNVGRGFSTGTARRSTNMTNTDAATPPAPVSAINARRATTNPIRRPMALHEHSRLFGYTPSAQTQKKKKCKVFSRIIVCLADCQCEVVPSKDEKNILKANGLGEANVDFQVDGDAEHVQEKIMSTFKKKELESGFEFMVTRARSRSILEVVHSGPCSSQDLKLYSSQRIYIRPIQHDITLSEFSPPSSKATLICSFCEEIYATSEIRAHVEQCKKSDPLPSQDLHRLNTDDELPAMDSTLPDVNINVTQDVTRDATRDVTRDATRDVTRDITRDITRDVTRDVTQDVTQDAIQSVTQSITQSVTPDFPAKRQEMDQIIRATIAVLQTTLDADTPPDVCLMKFADLFLEGRKLDPVSEEDMLGDTYRMFISRYNILDDIVSEVTCDDFKPNVTLFVEFFGEEASDLGGPRREMLQMAMQAVVERVLERRDEQEAYELSFNPAFLDKMYIGAGIIMGLCLLQGGPTPTLFSSELLDKVIEGGMDTNSPVGQFTHGLRVTGIHQLLQAFPQCRELLAYKLAVLKLPSLLTLFKKNFSEVGSNARQLEERTMGFFIRYLRQVSEGRRIVALEDVLEFVTGLRSLPPLGFPQEPQIIFEPSQAFLPKAQTCTNTLILPIPMQGAATPDTDFIYQMFDYGFKNAYFGLV